MYWCSLVSLRELRWWFWRMFPGANSDVESRRFNIPVLARSLQIKLSLTLLFFISPWLLGSAWIKKILYLFDRDFTLMWIFSFDKNVIGQIKMVPRGSGGSWQHHRSRFSIGMVSANRGALENLYADHNPDPVSHRHRQERPGPISALLGDVIKTKLKNQNFWWCFCPNLRNQGLIFKRARESSAPGPLGPQGARAH